jgi:hypothetical protein
MSPNEPSKFRTHLNKSTALNFLLKKCFEFYLCADFDKTVIVMSSFDHINPVKR